MCHSCFDAILYIYRKSTTMLLSMEFLKASFSKRRQKPKKKMPEVEERKKKENNSQKICSNVNSKGYSFSLNPRDVMLQLVVSVWVFSNKIFHWNNNDTQKRKIVVYNTKCKHTHTLTHICITFDYCRLQNRDENEYDYVDDFRFYVCVWVFCFVLMLASMRGNYASFT